MPDKEKVIKRLETICKIIEDSLPSYDAGYRRMACHDAIDLLQNAIDLLQEQETVEAFHKCSGYNNGYKHIWDPRFNFCPYCGRKVKWDA